MRFAIKGTDDVEENHNNHTHYETNTVMNSMVESKTKKVMANCVPTVIQATQQQSVIQSAVQQPTVLTKGNVILVSKPNSVIQTPQGNLQTLQVVVEANGSEDDDQVSPNCRPNTKKQYHRRGANSPPAARRRKQSSMNVAAASNRSSNEQIYTKLESSGSDCDSNSNMDSELSSHSLSTAHYQAVLSHDPLSVGGGDDDDVQTITMTPAGAAGGTILQYSGQDGQYFLPGEILVMQNTSGGGTAVVSGGESSSSIGAPEEQVKKREIRLLKNREAAKECRRKKKEYIKCLETRVAVLEAQNKDLISELKKLKDMYCSQNSTE